MIITHERLILFKISNQLDHTEEYVNGDASYKNATNLIKNIDNFPWENTIDGINGVSPGIIYNDTYTIFLSRETVSNEIIRLTLYDNKPPPSEYGKRLYFNIVFTNKGRLVVNISYLWSSLDGFYEWTEKDWLLWYMSLS